MDHLQKDYNADYATPAFDTNKWQLVEDWSTDNWADYTLPSGRWQFKQKG